MRTGRPRRERTPLEEVAATAHRLGGTKIRGGKRIGYWFRKRSEADAFAAYVVEHHRMRREKRCLQEGRYEVLLETAAPR